MEPSPGTTADAVVQIAAAKAAYDREWRKANPEYFREWRKANAPLPGNDDPRHGTRNGYYYGYRCTDCRHAAAEYERALRGRRRDAAGDA